MSSATRKDFEILNLKNKSYKKIISLRYLTQSFKPHYFRLLNDYDFKMSCNGNFKISALKHTKLAFNTYLDLQTSPL